MRRAKNTESPHVLIDGYGYIIEQGDAIDLLKRLRYSKGIDLKVSDEELKRLRKDGVVIPQNERLY